MRIACLSTDPGIAYGAAKGAAVHLTELAAALAADGADVLLLVAGIEPRAAPPRGVLVETVPGCEKGFSTAARLAAGPTVSAWVEERLARFGPTAVYERLALHSAAGSRAARALGIPHLVEVNAPLLEEAARYRLLLEPAAAGALQQEVLSAADLVLPVSRALTGYVSQNGARRVEVLPNAVTLDRFPPAPPRARAARQGGEGGTIPPLAVLAGRLRPWHGPATVARAWNLMSPHAPRLMVIGDGDGLDLLSAAGAEITGAVPHERVPGLLRRAGIGLVPYASDAPSYFSPLKLFEYLAAGLAVVAVPIPGVTDIVGADVAVLVPPGDPEALAAAVSRLAADPDERASRGRAGRALVEAAHTWSHRARRVRDGVRELAAVRT